MTSARGLHYKLGSLPALEDLFRQFAGACSLVYNLALEQRAVRIRKYRPGYVAEAADLTRPRAEFDRVRAVYVFRQQHVLRDLGRAFSNR